MEHSILSLNFCPKIFLIIYLKPVNIALLNQLMRSCNQIDSVDMAKVICNFRSEYPSCSSGIYGPIFNILRIWPHKVTKWSFVRNLYFSINSSNLVNSFYFRTETSVDTKSFSINNCSNWQIIKHFGAIFPRIWITIFSVDFIIKSINSSNLSL